MTHPLVAYYIQAIGIWVHVGVQVNDFRVKKMSWVVVDFLSAAQEGLCIKGALGVDLQGW